MSLHAFLLSVSIVSLCLSFNNNNNKKNLIITEQGDLRLAPTSQAKIQLKFKK